jgi:regulator of RNase E activity RraA
MAVDLAQGGDVIVVAAGGIVERALCGDMSATRFQAKGIAGVVIDGATRDVRGTRELRFPIFARGVTPRSNHYPQELDHGAVNVPVVCGGVLVRPGDIIIGDDDGVVVVPLEMAEEIAQAAARPLPGAREHKARRAAPALRPVRGRGGAAGARLPVHLMVEIVYAIARARNGTDDRCAARRGG